MFKKIIAAALATFVVATAAPMALASGGLIDSNNKKYKSSYYHECVPGTCSHMFEGKYLGLAASGRWGFVYATDKANHSDSYKYISITTYGYNKDKKNHYKKITIKSSGISPVVISNDANIDGSVSKVVYNGQIFRTSERNSGILQKYLIGSFRSGVPIK